MEVEESTYWHTTAHILAQAVKRLYPTAKLTIGPSIEKRFFIMTLMLKHLLQKRIYQH